MKIFLKSILFVIFNVIAVQGASSEVAGKIYFEHSQLSVLAAGHKYNFDIEIATRPDQQERGLMFRKEIADRHAMLFLFKNNQIITMWMKNTYIPLDIIFISKKGVIVAIARNAVPKSLDYISSRVPVISVLEVKGGITDRLGIKVGDRIEYPFFSR